MSLLISRPTADMDLQHSNNSSSAGSQYAGLTCITCRVIFARAELQREHYKTDWHRYNLKRKVAELAPLTAEQFRSKVLAHHEETQNALSGGGQQTRCSTCNKAFGSANAYENHLNSKKHKEFSTKGGSGSGKVSSTVSVESKSTEPVIAEKQPVTEPMAVVGDDDDEAWSDVDSDDGDGDDNDNANNFLDMEGSIPPDACLFCPVTSSSMEANLEHMYAKHGFFVPDLEFCSDLHGLVRYFGGKVGCGRMCLCCNRTLRSLDACRKHMRDKGHCRAAHEPNDMIELADFYDYSSSYPSDSEDDGAGSGDAASSDIMLDDGGWQLQLPSGATIGHRSLLRFYKQRLKPESGESRNEKRGRDAVTKVMGQYKALGWTGTTGEMAVLKARDMKFMKTIRAKQQLKLGLKANKLFVDRGRKE